MARPSSIEQLPDEFRVEIDRLLGDKRFTLDDIVAHMRRLGAPLSRSAIGRARKKYDRVMANVKESREIARAAVAELGAIEDDESHRLIIELLRNLVFRVLMNRSEDGDAGDVNPKELMQLGKTLQSIESAMKLNAETKAKIREQIAAEVKAKAEGAATNITEHIKAKGGLSAETRDLILSEILGCVPKKTED